MPYEPAINTTVSSTEKTKHCLDRAVEAAHCEGVGIIGFVVTQDGADTIFEPFSSTQLQPEEFVNLVAMGARGMVNDQNTN